MSNTSVSVIIPAYNAAAELPECLRRLTTGRVLPLEIIVVVDGSTDKTAAVAAAHGATVCSTQGRRGPAAARNLGASKAKGDILYFVDADVCVEHGTIERVQTSFANDPELDALIGSYDDDPGAQDFLSQYKNLMHCYVHQTGNREASTFWSGCGAIRRTLFLTHSGFDESYRRPAIEDIELGYRLKQAGAKMALDPELRVKHLKRWTFWNLVKTDIRDRGIPWTELILRDRNMPNDLNLQLSQRISVSLVFLCVAIAAAAAVYWKGYFLTPLFAALFFLLGRYWADGLRLRSKAVMLTMGSGFLAIMVLAWQHHMMGLIPLLLTAAAILALRHRYEYSRESRKRWVSIATGAYGGLALVYVLTFLPAGPLVLALVMLLLVVVVMNNQFYLFLAERRGRLFAIAAIPFHLLYHFYNGISFAIGLFRYLVLPRRQRSDLRFDDGRP